MPFNVQCKKCLHYRNEWCKQKLDSPDPDLVRDCLYYSTATNADLLRAMSDEELAEWIAGRYPDCPPGVSPAPLGCDDVCAECWLDWLRQEAT